MQYIHYHNDFTVPISLVSDSITINPDIIGQITFYTRNNGNSYCCCRDCKTLYVDGDNVMAVLNSHNLETGVLNYMVEYQIPDSNFPDGFQRICQHYTSNIELTTENGDITVAEAQIIYGDTIRELIESAGYSYTKEEIDEMIAQIDSEINTYSKPEIDALLATKANKNGNRNEDFVTRTLNLQREGASTSLYNYTLNGGEFVSFYDQTGSSLTYQFIPNQGDIIATERQLAAKANSNDVYTKGQVDDLLDNIDLPDNVVTDANYVHTDNNYSTSDKNKLSGIASGAEVNVQSDWNVTNSSSDAFIKNKPTIPTVDSSITGSNQSNPVRGGAIYNALNDKAGFRNYVDSDAMEDDTPDNGTIGFDADSEKFYIYDNANAEWRQIDGGGGVQSNWNETNTSSLAYIQNKPTIPTKTSDLTLDNTYSKTEVDSKLTNFEGDSVGIKYYDPNDEWGPYTLRITGEWDDDASLVYLTVTDEGDNDKTTKIPMGANLLSENGFETVEITDGHIQPFKVNVMKPSTVNLSIKPSNTYGNAPGTVMAWLEMNADDLTNVTRIRWNSFVFPANESIAISDFQTYSKIIVTVMGDYITNIARYT